MLTGHYSDVKEEVPAMPGMQATIRWLIAEKEGARNFAMRVIEVKRQGEKIPLHQHPYEHEVFVIEGEGSVLAPEGGKSVRPGDYVFVGPDERHGFENTGRSAFRFICVIPLPRR
jgi:quercetin dioxygenase-like cupin family protein